MSEVYVPCGTFELSKIDHEDLYRRRLPRSNAKDVEKPIHSSIQDRSSRCNLSFLKPFVLLITICGTFLTLLYSPEVYNSNHLSSSGSGPNFVNRWIRGGSDPRYITNVHFNWDDILQITEKLTGKKEFQGVGLLNFNRSELDHWEQLIPEATHVVLHLEHAAKNVTWESLFPEWIDEEETEVPTCPSLPSLRSPGIRLNLIAVKLPHAKVGNWSRDVARLHLQLAAARLATSFKGNYAVYVLFVTNFFPVPNLFTCKELVGHEGNVWLYKPNLNVLREKLHLPVGSCELALPLRGKGMKPWLCFRDYDCNWNSDIFHEFATDVAHERWWKVHDAMPELLQQFCMLKSKQKAQLEWDRRQAEIANYTDRHWRIKVKDKRLKKCIDNLCSWENMLKHWGESNWTDDESYTLTPPAITTSSLSGL
ncbi:UDP-glucuronate:xylan alpha-glucuronosyltransferase 3 [Spatholobus suberectus]|nr:UDP-glucuronate:xylan alpha-glucuronosyltransferase 3 [Spatholobus suberectus]